MKIKSSLVLLLVLTCLGSVALAQEDSATEENPHLKKFKEQQKKSLEDFQRRQKELMQRLADERKRLAEETKKKQQEAAKKFEQTFIPKFDSKKISEGINKRVEEGLQEQREKESRSQRNWERLIKMIAYVVIALVVGALGLFRRSPGKKSKAEKPKDQSQYPYD